MSTKKLTAEQQTDRNRRKTDRNRRKTDIRQRAEERLTEIRWTSDGHQKENRRQTYFRQTSDGCQTGDRVLPDRQQTDNTQVEDDGKRVTYE